MRRQRNEEVDNFKVNRECVTVKSTCCGFPFNMRIIGKVDALRGCVYTHRKSIVNVPFNKVYQKCVLKGKSC